MFARLERLIEIIFGPLARELDRMPPAAVQRLLTSPF